MKATAILAAASLLLGVAHAQNQPYDMAPINQIVDNLAEDTLLVVENPLIRSLQQEAADYKNLENICKTDWSEIIDNLGSVVGGEAGCKVVISALQCLDAADYMSALEKIVGHVEQGELDKKALKYILFSTGGRMRAFLEDNYTHPRTIALLNKIKVKVAGDANMIEYINRILSGAAKLSTDQFRDAHQGLAIGNIPRIILP